MINVDTVYQRVLVTANKEQRGYITPQEFNLFANQAQMEILKQYFYDMNQWERVHGNELEFSDNLNLLEEKLAPFKNVTTISETAPGIFNVNSSLTSFYKLGTVAITNKHIELEEVTFDEYNLLSLSPLTRPTVDRPVYYWDNGNIQAQPRNDINQVTVSFVRKPSKVEWGYVVLSSKALYNANASADFELHGSEETRLVYKILALAGITLQDPGVYKIASGEDMKSVQQEKQ